jgi:predicted Zn-ribbon and HTH transcriptional regulator
VIEGPGWVVLSALTERDAMSIRCPCCQSDQIHRSKTKGILERVSTIIFVRPYRCVDCDYRFFRWSLRVKPEPGRMARTS